MDDRKLPSSPDHDTGTKTKLTSKRGMKNFTSELSNLLGPDKKLSQDLKFLKTLNKAKVSVKAKSKPNSTNPRPVKKKKKTPVVSAVQKAQEEKRHEEEMKETVRDEGK